LVWSTRSKIAIETVATIAAITGGFRKARSIPINASAGPEFRLDHAARSGKTAPPRSPLDRLPTHPMLS
jgi:hypothetical protein